MALSADAIPDKIPGFLDDLVRVGRGDRIERWVAEHPQPSLAKYMPRAYADFALKLLLPRRRRPGPMAQSDWDEEDEIDDWRFVHNSAFLPASHLQGPFLVLLRANETEGLRVINTLVNAATEIERRRQDASDFSRLKPVTVPFPDGSRTFWGDITMYSWFRPLGNGSYAVTSALMALEVWMEEQVTGERDPEELFRTVLADSESIATVAVCVSVSLAHIDRCLRAAAPFVCTAALWYWDLSRATHDSSDVGSMFAAISLRPALERANAERSRQPHRRLKLRMLMPRYLFFTDDEALRDRVVECVRGFPDDLSQLTPEERASEEAVRSYRADMEINTAWADPANYRFYRFHQHPEEFVVEYVPPQAIRERHEDGQEEFSRMSRDYALLQWAKRS